METQSKTIISIDTSINATIEKTWEYWTKPEHITKWNNASDDWHTPRAENALRVGGKFLARMEAKDGSMGFDFGGTYDVVRPEEYIEYTLGDGRKVTINFTGERDTTKVLESFEAENTNPVDMQKFGWQAILDNFKRYTENN